MDKKYEKDFENYLGMSIGTVRGVVAKHLGIVTDFRIKKNEYSHHNGQVFFSLVEVDGANETDKAMRNNKALKQLFKTITMDIVCGYDNDANAGHYRVKVNYTHTVGGGSNGHELMSFCIDYNTGDVGEIYKD